MSVCLSVFSAAHHPPSSAEAALSLCTIRLAPSHVAWYGLSCTTATTVTDTVTDLDALPERRDHLLFARDLLGSCLRVIRDAYYRRHLFEWWGS